WVMRHSMRAGAGLLTLAVVQHAAMAQDAVQREEGDAAAPDSRPIVEDDDMIIVTGSQSAGVVAVGRNALAKSEQARSIQIYDDKIVQDLKPEALEDLVTLSANVSFAGNTDGREVRFNIRGFDNAPILRDGFRVNSFGGVSNPELWNLERVEVLKGPDSIVYGEASPGGIINLRTKRPQQDNFLYLQTEFGTDPSASPRFDLNLAADSGLISGRLVALYEIDDTFRDFDNPIETYSVSPSLRIDPAEGTIITFIGEATVEDGQADFGTVLTEDGDLAVPRDFVINHPRDENRREFYMVGVDAEQRILDGLTAEGRVRYFESGYQYSSLFLPFTYDPSTRSVFRAPAVQGNDGDELAAQLNLFGEFGLGGTRHRFTAGVDYRDSFTETVTRFDPGGAIPLDLDNPDYSILPPPGDSLPAFPGVPQDQERVGVFLQYYFNPIDNLLINGGVRYDDVRLEDADTGATIRDFDNTSLQAGVRYEFSEAFSIFGSYSESFTPSTALDLFNEPLPPQIGEGYEVGIKGQLFAGRLAYAVSYFDITNNNIPRTPLVIPPDALNPFGSVPAGEEEVEGVDVDISGAITEAWSVIFSFGYLDGEAADGFRLLNVADVTSALFTRYDITENWGVSVGYEFIGDRQGVSDIDGDPATVDPLIVDSHFIGNAAIYYQRGRFNAQLNVSNIFDERYVDSIGGLARENYPGAPTEALLTLGVEF
ncbi:MAG: TonB-dependent receptor, partial [Pseudomonadota bacterium]